MLSSAAPRTGARQGGGGGGEGGSHSLWFDSDLDTPSETGCIRIMMLAMPVSF